MDEQARRWLEEYAHELPPEDILSEEEKATRACSSWPIPKSIPNMGVFSEITSQDKFNDIIGEPKNWPMIHLRQDLYNQWIIPHAVILFGKVWFDRVKWRNSVHKSVPFPLFSEEEKRNANENGIRLEDTTHGRATIAKIIEKINYALGVYLEGKWLEKSTYMKKPGGYIIDSIKNEFIREIGTDLGYKLKSVLACPYCLSNTVPQKTPLIYHGSLQYSCPRCDEYVKNLECALDSDFNVSDKIKSAQIFRKFIGITCICPSDECKGKFVPINSIDFENWKTGAPKKKLILIGKILKTISISRNTQGFVMPPAEILDLPLFCPFCNIKFTPRSALNSKAGFKKKSGFLTGLPSISIWEQKCTTILDQDKDKEAGEFSQKNNLVSEFVDLDNQILAKQNINILINEIICHMARIKINSAAGLTTWCFFMATIKWMLNYPQDAFRYFFGWSVRERDMTEKEMALYPGENKKKMTDVLRGQTASVHQSLFYTWMDVLEENIEKFTKLDPSIQSIKDFKWFCRAPKFSGGPMSIFRSVVNSKLKIPNNTNIINLQSKRFSPRIARVYSIHKFLNGKIVGNNLKKDIRFCEWQAIQMNNCGLVPGDLVRVEALIMPGHTTHAPIQRIIRLRTKILGPLIERIQDEEKTGKRDLEFWRIWKNKVERSKKVTGLDIELKE